jgi:hypothetical protein
MNVKSKDDLVCSYNVAIDVPRSWWKESYGGLIWAIYCQKLFW